MEDWNLASVQAYTIEVQYKKNKVLNHINIKDQNTGGTAMLCGSKHADDALLIVVVPGTMTTLMLKLSIFRILQTTVNSIQTHAV